MSLVVLSLGSNIDAEGNMNRALEALAKTFAVRSRSSFIWTKPVGFTDQPDFLNGVVLLETEMEPGALADQLKVMETILGRQSRENRWGPREIDLDILIWNGHVINHDYYEREFLRKAVSELLPEMKQRCF